ncbi:MAG: uracil-DNA glycosylase [Aquificae bacterium]|nr:uracil-DNA glycosylase [Aquificota bacterium]
MGIEETVKALQAIGINELYLGEKMEQKEDRWKLLRELYEQWKDCKRCDLHKSRTQVVPGDGNPYSPIVFVGEAPGEEEDKQGKPFVGRAGQLLNKLIEEELGMKREDVYITNVCKCRPPNNRKPTPIEMKACSPYLRKEIEIIKPKIICCLGATAGEGVLGKSLKITKVRGQVFPYPYDPKIKVFLTYHPAYVLRNPKEEKTLREDFRKLRELLSQLS